jgi:hypothetical protein
VEPSNSWSTGDLTLNLSALGGMIDRLAELKLPIGIYSSPVWWDEIMGGVTNRLVVADWVAGVPIDRACTGRGFSGAPVWLVQELAPWVGPDGAGFDSDRVC